MLLSWAREDAEDFDSIAQAFFDTQPYEAFGEVDPDTGEVTQKIRILDPPSELRKLAAHVLSDLKHALDQAAFAASAALLSRPPDTLYFPVASHPNDLNAKLQNGAYPVELHATFKALEPYPTGNGYSGGSDDFCALSKMANTSKHVVAVSAVPRINLAGARATASEMAGMRLIVDGWDAAKKELTVGISPKGANTKVNLQIASFVAFDEVGPFEGESVGSVLEYFIGCVQRSIDALEAAVAAALAARP